MPHPTYVTSCIWLRTPKNGGTSLVTANMRHASLRSGEAYQAGAEVFVEAILATGNTRILQLIQETGLGKDLSQ